MIDEVVDVRFLSGDAFEIEPGVCVGLGRREIGTAELVSSTRIPSRRELVTPQSATSAGDTLVEMGCFESDVCCGCGDGNWY